MSIQNEERRNTERESAREVSFWFAAHIAAYYQVLLGNGVPADLAHVLTEQYQLAQLGTPGVRAGWAEYYP